MKKYKEPALANIDQKYKIQLDVIKKKHEDNPEHYVNRLEAKYIYIFAIIMALKYKLKPVESKKKAWIFRTEGLKRDEESETIFKSLIFSFKKDIKILLPENYEEYYSIAEKLANAGMERTLKLLNSSDEIEKMILVESQKFLKN